MRSFCSAVLVLAGDDATIGDNPRGEEIAKPVFRLEDDPSRAEVTLRVHGSVRDAELPDLLVGDGRNPSALHERRTIGRPGVQQTEGRKVWGFLGDGECDEPETLGGWPV